MKINAYIRAEQRVAKAARAEVIARWRWGQTALADPSVTTPAGTLRKGITEQLIHAARHRGLELDEIEIRRRVQCSRTYPTEAELTRALRAGYGTWDALCEARFPAPDGLYQRPALISPEGHVNPEAVPWHQASLDDDGDIFPRVLRIAGSDHDRDQTSLRLLETYLRGCERWTDAHARRNRRMRERLAALVDAAGGNLEMRYDDAIRLQDTVASN